MKIFFVFFKNLSFTLFFLACATNKVPSYSTENDDLAKELYYLKAKIDDLNNRFYILNEQLDAIRAKTSSNIVLDTKIEKKVALQDNKEITNSKIREEYNQAYKNFLENRFAKSLMLFTNFIEKYPNSALTDNAYFWVGEAYFKQAEYKLAIDEYNKVINKFPNGSKAPDAMLKTAISYELLNNKDEALTYYKDLIKKYPNSKASITAKNNMDKIR